MPKQSKFFRVAVEGDTVDGREISRQDLIDMASTYNPDTYGARVNMEHIRGISADKPFRAYGDVIALRTDQVEIQLDGKPVKKLALFAQIDPTDDLVALNGARQKIYTSVEINPNFAKTGKAYLMGLAVTDSPASLATEALKFVAHRKLDPANIFTAAAETSLEFVDVAEPNEPEATGAIAAFTGFMQKLTAAIGGSGGAGEEKPTPTDPPAGQEPANDNFAQLQALVSEGFAAVNASVSALSNDVKGATTAVATLRTDHDTLKASIENTDGGGTQRPIATGGGNFTATDC